MAILPYFKDEEDNEGSNISPHHPHHPHHTTHCGSIFGTTTFSASKESKDIGVNLSFVVSTDCTVDKDYSENYYYYYYYYF